MFHILGEQWARREHFRHYMDNLRCTYSLTVQVDISKLRKKLREHGLKVYPAQIYMLATVVNRFPAFRMGLSAAGEPGYWARVDPAYTIFHADTETFSGIWTPYDEAFPRFYRACLEDIERYAGAAAFAPKAGKPANTFDISSVPWVDFTAFNLNVYAEGTHLLPIFTVGRFVEQGDTVSMPLAMQLHHAACDGYHAGRFVEALREMADACGDWL